MKESNGVLRTKIISDDENKHVYEICREFELRNAYKKIRT